MKKLVLTAALGASCLALAACGDKGTATADSNNSAAATAGTEGAAGAEGNTTTSTTTTTTASTTWPKGARIVEENGVTYRVDADGTRVALGANDSKIVVDKGVRYRVDSSGTRVKINDQGLDIDLPDLTPDVDVGTNEKGHLDVDVKGHKDGDTVPN
jgi:predicted small lipoprotein YifL